ncbi:Folylpolyglutamate synthase [Novosphingobium resinovorum]|uniref:Dihydrofolate synthase/folylpolyglutamate synthase n=2 Tax=Novosphingobium resinovorum TaxID=158500 RepID=A0A031K425_9SPHN|nr:folylpolyglutamate synthase/dihydrofolate synthase family protein [Novosphingobium lentum]EZP83964.1 Folylpolyglutamate synthase [Novosphingobium resinovorum]
MRPADFAVSDHPGVQRQLGRIAVGFGTGALGLGAMRRLLQRLDNPHHRMPPAFHVAGTNGKGSTCAFLRAMLEAAGQKVHVYTSPHLVRLNERIRIAGALVEDAVLAELLEEVLDAGEDLDLSFFEAMTAAAFLAFARCPADAAIVEVGLGGRLDATNLLRAPAATGIAQLALDHQFFLGDDLCAIAAEKAGIAKAGVQLVTLDYADEVGAVMGRAARSAGAIWRPEGKSWSCRAAEGRLDYRDKYGPLALPLPALAGDHQADNAGLAVAMLRHQTRVAVAEDALRAGIAAAHWPARLQRLGAGPLIARFGRPSGEVWLDGGHNPAAGRAVAAHFTALGLAPGTLTLIIGMLANKDAEGFLAALAPLSRHMHMVPVEGHDGHMPDHLAQVAERLGITSTVHASLDRAATAVAAERGPLLIAGSLHLAGLILRLNDEAPP